MSSLQIKARQVGGWYDIGAGVFTADPGDPPPPDGWQDVYDSGDLELIEEWYAANTGYDSNGFTGPFYEPVDPDTPLEITTSWLTANEGANVVHTPSEDYKWTITHLHNTKLRISVSDLKISESFVDRSSIHDINGSGVEVFDPVLGSTDGVDNENIWFDRCTLKGGQIYKPSLKQIVSNVVTLTIGTHPFEIGDHVFVTLFPLDGSMAAFNGDQTITAKTSTTISYAKTASNVASSAASGVVTYSLEGDYGDAVSYSPEAGKNRWDLFKFSYCKVSGWPAGFKFYRNSTAEYCYVYDLDLYGADPHNTSSSLRGDHCRLFRNYFTDGTSSDISLYADLDPYTEFEVIGNILWVDPQHAIYEINFPNRSPNFWNVLTTGYRRVMKGNKLQRGTASDLQYFTEISDNKLLTGEKIFGGAAAPEDRTINTPSVVAGFSGGFAGYSNPSASMVTFPFTPSNNSTMLLFHAIGQGGHTATPVPSVSDTAGATWAKITNTQTAIENAPANLPAYGISTVLWTVETGTGEAFRKVTVDPYSGSEAAYESMMIVEMTGVKNMLLAQPRAIGADGHALGFGATRRNHTSGSLGSPATTGNDVFLFVAFGHDDNLVDVDPPTEPSGWHLVGYIREKKTAIAIFWRNDFTGTSVTISDLGANAGAVVSTLVEFSS